MWHHIFIPIHGDYTSNFSKTRHDTKMLIQTLGEYNPKLSMIRQKLVDSNITKVNQRNDYQSQKQRRTKVQTRPTFITKIGIQRPNGKIQDRISQGIWPHLGHKPWNMFSKPDTWGLYKNVHQRHNSWHTLFRVAERNIFQHSKGHSIWKLGMQPIISYLPDSANSHSSVFYQQANICWLQQNLSALTYNTCRLQKTSKKL